MENSNTKDISSQYFKTFMRFRKQTMVEIAEHTGISKRTLQGYAQGNPPFRKASATNFIAITDYMEIDPHYMLGSDKWKISEYLENILKENNLKSFSDISRLPESVRLTKATRKYRAEKRSIRKLKKIHNNKIQELKFRHDMYDLNRNITIKVKYRDGPKNEDSRREMEARIRAYIEAFRKLEDGKDEEIIEWRF